MSIFRNMSRANIVATLSLLVAFASLAALGLVLLEREQLMQSAAAGGASLTEINAAIAKINVKRRGGELPWEKAMRVRTAIRQGDFATASKITSDVLAASKMESWHFEPFESFMAGISDVTDASLETRLGEWVAEDDKHAAPLLIRAQYYHDAGWFRRGGAFVKATQADDMMAFVNYMDKGLIDINKAIRLDDANPYAQRLKLRILRGGGPTKAMMTAFQEAIAKYPDYYPLYEGVLVTLRPEWGGSIEFMRAFVDQYAGQVAETSPRKLLYLSLYRHLLAVAVATCRDDQKAAECVTAEMRQTFTPALQSQVQIALQLYDHTDKYQFGIALQEILLDTLYAWSAEFYSGAILELAGSSMHSDTRLHLEQYSGNDYMVDLLVAESWYQKSFNDSALEKDDDALMDIAAVKTLSDEQRDVAAAAVYGHMAKVYAEMRKYPEMIAAAKAAVALGGRKNEEHLICYGYVQFKDYEAASEACVRAMDSEPTNMRVHYLRGQIFQAAKKEDEALQEFAMVAESTDSIRSSGSIALSLIYFDRKDFKGALDVLNKYTYLYNADMTGQSDMAVAYNNRCFAYMELGELEKALQDCTASLKYGSIPDAYRKQLELTKRLGKKAPEL